MKKIKTLLALMLSAVLMLTAVSVTSFADEDEDALTFDTAKEFDKDDTVKGEMPDGSARYYKIDCESKGTLAVSLTCKISRAVWFLYDEDGAEVPLEGINVKAGENINGTKVGGSSIRLWADGISQKSTAVLTYKVKKGDYYVVVQSEDSTGGKFSFSADFKKDSKKEFSYLGITLKKGATMQLEAVNADAEDTKWTSSKKSVATVSSKGKIKAKKKGSTIITCKSGDVVVKLKITVK